MNIWAIVISANTKTHAHVLVYVFNSFGYISGSRTVNWCAYGTVNILRNCQTLFQSSGTTLYVLICTVWGATFSRSLQALAPVCLSISAIPLDAKRYLFVLLISISLMMNDVDIFSCTSWPTVHLFQRNVCPIYCPFFNIGSSVFYCWTARVFFS